MNESKSYSINYDPGKEYMIERPTRGGEPVGWLTAEEVLRKVGVIE